MRRSRTDGGAGFAVDRGPERVDVERALVPAAVDEERRGPGGAALVGALDVARDPERVPAVIEVPGEPVHVQPDLARVAEQVVVAQRVAPGEQAVVHLPELPRRAGDLGRLRRHLRVLVHVGEREVTEDVAEVGAVHLHELAHDRLGLPAVRALEVRVLDEGDRRVLAARARGHVPGPPGRPGR